MAKGSRLRRRVRVLRRALLIFAVGVVAALTGAMGARSPAPKATPPVRLTATSQAIAAATPTGPVCAPACASPLVRHGGPVQSAPRVYLVFWGPKWSADPAGIMPALQELFGHLSHSAYEQVLAQYGVGDVVSLAGSWIDTEAPAGVVTRGGVLREAVNALTKNQSWTNDANTQIVVLPENGTTVATLADTAPTPTEDTDYCGWHYYGPSATYGRIVYTLLPYLAQKRFRSGCISYGHGNLRDAMTTVESHEFAEAATDPTLNGWTTDQGTGSYEIGDLCAYPGVHVPLGPPEEVQLLWSNQDNRCEPVPTLGVDPESGPPSTELVVTGDHFGPHEQIDLRFGGAPGPSASANALGSFTARLPVPAGAREGYYSIQATGRLGGHVSTASFDVVTDAWPQLGFDASHSADNPAPTPLDATTASHLEVAWTGSTDGHHSANPLSTGQVVVGDGMVVEGTADAAEHDGYVYAYHIGCGDGATVTCSPTWYAELGGNVYGAAAISGNDVYVAASDGALYAFSATCGTNDAECTPVWTARTAGGIDSSPTVEDGVIYVGSSADATDGDHVWLSAFPVDCAKVCRPLWQADIPLHGPEVASSPTVADGMVYEVADLVWAFPVGCGAGGAMCQPLWAYPWQTETVGINTPVAASGQEIYSLSGFGVLASPARCPKVTDVPTVPGGKACQLSGEPDWWGGTWPSDQWSVALYRGYLFSSSNRFLYGYLAAACASSFVPSAPVLCPPLWTAQPGRPDETTTVFTSGPIIANGVVFAPVEARFGPHLYAYRTVGCSFTCQRPLAAVAWPRFGATSSSAVTSDRSSEGGPPSVAGGVVYVPGGSRGVTVVAFALPPQASA